MKDYLNYVFLFKIYYMGVISCLNYFQAYSKVIYYQ
jgi:hypothetical protein